MKPFLFILLFILIPTMSFAATDQEVRQIIIKGSLQSYPGSCPCPYSTMKNGRQCGRRSAYSRPGGRSPLCYPNDVTAQMIQNYRTTHNLKQGNCEAPSRRTSPHSVVFSNIRI